MFSFNEVKSESGSKRNASSALLLQQEDDDEEDEEIIPQVYQPPVLEESAEYSEARQSIELDVWDVNAWMILIDEVKSKRSGALTIIQACDMFLKQFPKCAQIWQLYCEALLADGLEAKAEEFYKKNTKSCRNVSFWKSYILYVKKITIDRTSKTKDNYQVEKRKLESVFESALENIGLTIDSYAIWRMHIDFIKDWPDIHATDPGKKLAALRKIYQRCICIPIDGMDDFFKEYVTLEKSVGEHLAEQLLPEYTEKYTNAKLIYKERKRLMNKIDITKLSRVPGIVNNFHELEQLDAWNKYIRYKIYTYVFVY